MKKRLIILVGIAAIVLSIALLLIKKPVISFDKTILTENEDAYTSIAILCYNDYRQFDTDKVFTYLISNSDRALVRCNDGTKLNLSDNDMYNIQCISSSFILDKHSLSHISVSDSFVAFEIENGRASLIYSYYDEKPFVIDGSNKNKKYVYIEKIVDNWYYECIQ